MASSEENKDVGAPSNVVDAPETKVVESSAAETDTAPEEPKPKKKAIVVYEGDERWQPPSGTGNPYPQTSAPPALPARRQAQFAADDDEATVEGENGDDDEESTVDGSDEEDEEAGPHGDLLASWPDDSEDIQLLHSRISSIPALRLPRFAATLKTLCLRQNAIAELPSSEISPLRKLEEFDIYDNQVKELGMALEGMPELRTLDLSFNLLRAVPPVVSTLPKLETVYFVQNKISRIENGLSSPSLGAALRSLELGGNRLRAIEGLDALVNLEELWLGKNKITKLENLSTLKKLKILALQSNRIIRIEGLEELTNLEELYLSHNGVLGIEGLAANVKLTTLDVSNNRVPAIENLSHLTELQELWLNDNQIPNLHALEPELGKISTLETIYLEGNPCQREDQGGYRRKIQLALPQVKQIDATYTRAMAMA